MLDGAEGSSLATLESLIESGLPDLGTSNDRRT